MKLRDVSMDEIPLFNVNSCLVSRFANGINEPDGKIGKTKINKCKIVLKNTPSGAEVPVD